MQIVRFQGHRQTIAATKTKMESSKTASIPVCRVCNENGFYELSEMKFRCNDCDILLIDAFNSFSTLNNVSNLFLLFVSWYDFQVNQPLKICSFSGRKRHLFVQNVYGIIDIGLFILAKSQTIRRETDQSIGTEIIDRTASRKYRNK